MSVRVSVVIVGVIAVWGVASGAATRAQAPRPEPGSWSPRAAAAYLDSRAAWWAGWPNAARDHGTFCVSCHTAAPYALARPLLRTALGERDPSASERALYDNVVKRVTLWRETEPYYPDQTRGIPKTSESRGTEAVLNALVLASRDAAAGHLSDETRTAFSYVWGLQMRTGPLSGAWAWLNFQYEPWESTDAPYFGASLAALAVALAPDGYASSDAAREQVARLRTYLQREHNRQSGFNRLMALWASTRLGGVITPEQRQAIVDAALAAQQDDGGWSMASLGSWKRVDGTPLDTRSDGYATGLVTLVLQQAGLAGEARVTRGLAWLQQHQDRASGQWAASSLNKQRDPASDSGRFMSDAATAYAALSLMTAEQQGGR